MPEVPKMTAEEHSAIKKAAFRLIPFIAFLYVISFLDRVNVGFAALTMNEDIGLSAAAYGFGAGIFFIGYFLFEIPSNLMLNRLGARRWIARILVSWGILSSAMAFVTGPTSFWIVRFLLGIAEAGFFPGIVLYLTFWFPNSVRGKIMGWFLVAIPISSVIGAPLSTWLLEKSVLGFAGWQTMFLVEGLPAVFLGLVTWRFLPDGPRDARWLSPHEAELLTDMVDRDNVSKMNGSLSEGLFNVKIWFLAAVYFGIVIGLYGFSFWGPQIIQSLGDVSIRNVGYITVAPYLAALFAMIFWARHSDAKSERRWHLALAAFLGAAGFIGSAMVPGPVEKVIFLSVAAMGVHAALPIFWTLPTAILRGTAAAGGIALINSIGNLGGYLGPVAVGALYSDEQGYGLGMIALSFGLIVAALLVLFTTTKAAEGDDPS